MIKTRRLLLKLAKRFPKAIAKKHGDFVGLMHGSLPESVAKIVLCLDFDESIYEQTRQASPDLIITHHPFIYGSKRFILQHDPHKKALCDRLDRDHFAVYSFHTNFDEGRGGMNDALAQQLGLKNIKAVEAEPMMRIGELETPMNPVQFAQYAKDQLKVSYGLLIDKGPQLVKHVALIGGAGSRNFMVAKEAGADLFLSGDVPHHVRRDMILERTNYLDLPHEIEKIFMPTMKEILLSIDPSLEIVIIDHEKEPQVIA